MKDSVRFYNCSQCGHDWESKIELPFWTKERIIEERVDLDKLFGDHLCHRCTWRDILISLSENAGKKADLKKIDAQLKEKYGY